MATPEAAPTTVYAHELDRMLDQVRAHQFTDDYIPVINGIHFDSNGRTLHAVATDRYTFAVARTIQQATSTPWAHTIPTGAAKALRKWVHAEEPMALITITTATVGGDTNVTFASENASLSFKAVLGKFPKWRGLLASALEAEPSNDIVGLDSEYAARWASGERNLRSWHTSATGAVVFAGENFLGLQMPTRPRSGEWQHAEIASAWAATLGATAAVDPAAELGDGIEGKEVRDFNEDLLRRVVTGTDRLMNDIGPDDHERFADVVSANIYAWIGYRLLRVLRDVSPGLTEQTLQGLDEELQGGEFAEWAWEYAREAGHSPEEWVKQSQAVRAERDAKPVRVDAAAEPSETPSAITE